MSLSVILVLIAAVLFGLATWPVPTKINLVAAGLCLCAVAYLVSVL
jgi:hypothetical protein